MLDQPTDEKLNVLGAKVDDLRAQMEKGFARVDAELREQRQEMKAGFARVDERFAQGDARVGERFERMHRLSAQLCGGIIVALIGLIATQV